MEVNVLTIFPEAFEKSIDFSILKRAAEKGIVKFNVINIRDFAEGKHKNTDDTPYGGEGGMIMKPEPIVSALESIRDEKTHVIVTSASGRKLCQEKLEELSKREKLAIICGRYEGIDERVMGYADEEISIGDYVLSGGEFAALVIAEGVIRLIPGVLGNGESAINDSFAAGILDFPQYTRPRDFRGKEVPEELLSGNHELIKKWRRKKALEKTLKNRPDLLEKIKLSDEDEKMMNEIRKGEIK